MYVVLKVTVHFHTHTNTEQNHMIEKYTRDEGHTAAHSNRNLEQSAGFVGMMTWNVLRDLPFSGNQPLKTANELYIRFWKI